MKTSLLIALLLASAASFGADSSSLNTNDNSSSKSTLVLAAANIENTMPISEKYTKVGAGDYVTLGNVINELNQKVSYELQRHIADTLDKLTDKVLTKDAK